METHEGQSDGNARPTLLIEPLWNGNELVRPCVLAGCPPSNRTIVEWKLFRAFGVVPNESASNRTIVEWKPNQLSFLREVEVASNRTIVEWKQDGVIGMSTIRNGF